MEVLRTATHLGRRAKPSTETLSRVAASDLVVLSTPAILRGTLPHHRFLQRAGLSSAQLLATQIVTNTALIQPRWSASASASGKFLSAGCEVQYPGQFLLQLVTVSSASSPMRGVLLFCDCALVRQHPTTSGSPYLMRVGLDSPEWHHFVILTCDTSRKPKYFGPRAKKSLLRFILHKRTLVQASLAEPRNNNLT